MTTATLPDPVIAELERVVGTRWVRRDQTSLEVFASDALPLRRRRPGCVVFPGDRDEVVGVVRVCAAHDIAFVARGAGTGLSGGALADASAVVIALTRLTRIIRIDARNRRAVVEPGVVNARLSAAAAPYGLYYAPDPSSQTACTIGGNVAENAGGPHCLKYGVTTQHILELEVVLSNGEVVTLGSPGGEAWGPDLVAVFVGSEGMFGIATQITVRLVPRPREIRTLLADFTSLRQAGEAVTGIIGSGLVAAALEMMDQRCIQAVEASVYAAGYPTDAAAILLVELDGMNREGVEDEARIATATLEAHGARRIRAAATPDERERLWQGRKKAFGAMGRISRDLFVQDAVVPRTALADVLEQIAAIAERHGLMVSNVFHAGDGNLHPNINFDARDGDARHRVELASAEIMAVCVDAGGTITGEHGVGLDKIHYMGDVFDPDTLGAMRAVRRAFDPDERANPGKVVPIHACREWYGVTGGRS